MIKKLIVWLIKSTLIVSLLLIIYAVLTTPSLPNRDLMIEIYSDEGACSGSYLKSPNSTTTYILTAAHCFSLLDRNGRAKVLHEDGSVTEHHLVKRDVDHDLMILSSDAKLGLNLGKRLAVGETIYCMSHPYGRHLVSASGSFDWYRPLTIPPFMFGLLEGLTHFHGGTGPGSSGSPILNREGNVVGVLSAGSDDDADTYFIRLDDIQEFLKNVR